MHILKPRIGTRNLLTWFCFYDFLDLEVKRKESCVKNCDKIFVLKEGKIGDIILQTTFNGTENMSKNYLWIVKYYIRLNKDKRFGIIDNNGRTKNE